MRKFIIYVGLALLLAYTSSFSQIRIAVLPFQNMDGNLKLNLLSYQMQDSLIKALVALDPTEKNFKIIPADSIESLLSQMNLDPTNPQYPTDMWKAVKSLNAKKVISGNFNIRDGKLQICAYFYDVRTKLANPDHQAKDIILTEQTAMEAIQMIIEALKPILLPN